MRKGWAVVLLGSVCKIAKSKHNGELLPYVGMENIESGTGHLAVEPASTTVKSATFRFNKGHILYGRLRPYLNKVLISDFEGHCSTEIFPLECGSRLERRFLFYWLTSEITVRQIDRTSTGTRMPRANINAMLDFDFPLPPLAEQKRIVAILDEAFAGIATAVAIAEKNLVNARELFESHLNAVFSQEGERWPVVTLAAACKKIQDGAHRSPKNLYPEPGPSRFPYLTSRNIRTGHLKLDTVQYCDAAFHNEIYPRCNPELGDVLLTKDGANTGNVAINTLDEPFSLLSSVCLLKPDRTKLLSRFLTYYIQSNDGFEQITGQMTGAAIKRIILKTIKSSRIPLCPLPEQERIVTLLDRLQADTRRLESIYRQKLDSLAELKQSILQKAFAGELTAEPDKALAEAGT